MASMAVALFDFEAQRSDNLSFKQGDALTILEQSSSGWWSGSDSTGRIGIFPYNYVQLKVDDTTEFQVARALYDFESEDDDDLGFREGELLTIIQELSAEWYLGRSEDGTRTGQFPSSYVEMLEDDAEQSDKKDKRAIKAAQAEAKKFQDMEAKAMKEAEKAKKRAEKAAAASAAAEAKLKAEEQARKEAERQQAIRQAAEKRAIADEKRLVEEAQRKADMQKTVDRKKAEENKKKQAAAEMKTKAEAKRRSIEAKVAAKEQKELDAKMDAITKAEAMMRKYEQEAEDAKRKQKEAMAEYERVKSELEKQKRTEDESSRRVSMRKSMNFQKKEMQKAMAAEKVSFAGKLPPVPPMLEVEEPETMEEDIEEVEVKAPAPSRGRAVNFAINKKFAGLGGGSGCGKCGKIVGFADKVQAVGASWHTNCFRCTTCSVILRQGKFMENKNNPYCKICYGKGFGPKGFGVGGVMVAVDRNEKKPDFTDNTTDTSSLMMKPKKRESKRRSSSKKASEPKKLW